MTFMENEDASSTFEDPGAAPNLQALRALGSYVPDYYGVGHNSLDNYLALFGGEKPTTDTEADCMGHTVGSCEYPESVPTLGTTLTATHDSWKLYSEGMDGVPVLGANCLHQTDPDGIDEFQGPLSNGYATRHNPAKWFDSVIDHPASCDVHSVDYTRLATDDRHASTLPTFSFVEPDTCHDGHDDSELEGYCAGDPEGASAPHGVAAIDAWARQRREGRDRLVSTLLDSPAWQHGNNLLVISFDEAIAPATGTGTGGDTSGVRPCKDGSDGGRIGALLIGTGVRKGFVSTYEGDHYGLLRTIEDSEKLPTLASKAVGKAARSTVMDGSAKPITDVFTTAKNGAATAGAVTGDDVVSTTTTGTGLDAAADGTSADSRSPAFPDVRAVLPLAALALVGAGGATAALRRRR